MSEDLLQRIQVLERKIRWTRLQLVIAAVAFVGLTLLAVYQSTQLDLTRSLLNATQANLRSQEAAERAREFQAQSERDRDERAKKNEYPSTKRP